MAEAMASKNLNVLDNTTVINDLLFFIINKFEILNNVTCVDKCVEYYSANLISESKDLILGDTARFLEQKDKKQENCQVLNQAQKMIWKK